MIFYKKDLCHGREVYATRRVGDFINIECLLDVASPSRQKMCVDLFSLCFSDGKSDKEIYELIDNIIEDSEFLLEELHQIFQTVDVLHFDLHNSTISDEVRARFSKIDRYTKMIEMKYDFSTTNVYMNFYILTNIAFLKVHTYNTDNVLSWLL